MTQKLLEAKQMARVMTNLVDDLEARVMGRSFGGSRDRHAIQDVAMAGHESDDQAVMTSDQMCGTDSFVAAGTEEIVLVPALSPNEGSSEDHSMGEAD